MKYERFSSSADVRKRMQKMSAGRDTSPEMSLRRALHRRGLRYRIDHDLGLADVRRRADVVFTKARVAVFVDGCFWHCCPEHGSLPSTNAAYWRRKLGANVNRDAETTALAEAAGWTILRVWEHDDMVAVANRVERLIR